MTPIPLEQRQKLIQYNEKPFRIVLTKAERLNNLKNKQTENELFRKDNIIEYKCLLCGSGYSDTIVLYSSGYVVCSQCGYIPNTMPIFQELEPFLYKSVNLNNSDLSWGSGYKSSVSGYSRYFHFNEIIAALNLEGPKIPNMDMQIIRTEIQREGLGRTDKSRIQRIQRKIDKKHHIKRFSRRYGEKWIQIGYRTFKERPDRMSAEFKTELRLLFKRLICTWPQIEHIIKGSKKDGKRYQWPNYTVTMYEILKRCFPSEFPLYKNWLPLLSEKKLKELKPSFDAMFYLTGLNK